MQTSINQSKHQKSKLQYDWLAGKPKILPKVSFDEVFKQM
jgi:hypothetical protein